jgi:hypothetical protein
VRHVAPSKPAGPYLITGAPDWWKLSDSTSWKEPLFGGQYGPVWVSPMPTNEVAARLEMRVQSAAGQRFTVGEYPLWRPLHQLGFTKGPALTNRQPCAVVEDSLSVGLWKAKYRERPSWVLHGPNLGFFMAPT